MIHHTFDIEEATKQIRSGGHRFLVDQKTHPVLTHMALASLVLEEGGVREPHWHPNASELAYCVEGEAVMTLFTPGNRRESFFLSAGDVAYIPQGFIHHIENIGPKKAHFLLCYNHGSPEDLNLSGSLSAISSHVLGATFNKDDHFFDQLKTKEQFIFQKKRQKNQQAIHLSPYKFALEKINPQIQTRGGLARVANTKSFPVLDQTALFSLRIHQRGVREPHWHPNATELNYVISGTARLTLLSPGKKPEHFELKKGQGSILPAGYLHDIENSGITDLHMAVFFSHPMPSDIGLSGALSAYSDEMLAALCGIDPALLKNVPKFEEDRMIVEGHG